MKRMFMCSIMKRIAPLSLLLASCLTTQAHAYVISDLSGTPTEGWDGAGVGAVTINYYLGWSGAPEGDNGLIFGSLSVAQVESELANAMATWSSVADVTFNYLGNAVSNPGLAANPWGSIGNETLVVYAHGSDLANGIPFDGQGLSSVFAHAWGPADIMGGTGFEFAGNIHMDGEENWLTGLADGALYSGAGGIDLETIFLHELGHSLGLGHTGNVFASPGGNPVMSSFSNQAVSGLGADDIDGIRQLYSFQGEDWSNGDPGTQPTVPIPGTLYLLGIGLIGFSASRKKKLIIAINT